MKFGSLFVGWQKEVYEHPHKPSESRPYKTRWTFFGCPWFRLCLFRFTGDDWADDPHDHPNWFFSLGLRGGYFEEEFDERGNYLSERRYKAPWVRVFYHEHIHRILAKRTGGAWALCAIGQEKHSWGFWVNQSRLTPVEYNEHLKRREHVLEDSASDNAAGLEETAEYVVAEVA